MSVIFLTIVTALIIALAKMVHDHHEAQGENGTRHASVMMGACGVILVLLGLGSEGKGWNLWLVYGIGIVASAAVVASIGWFRAHSSDGGRHSLG